MDWGTFFSVFGLVFVAELGDKTQLAVVTQTCKYRRPVAVFGGASVALAIVTVIGVIGGQVLGRLIPQQVLRLVAALAFVVMGILIAREASQGEGDVWGENACDHGCEDPGADHPGGPRPGGPRPGGGRPAAASLSVWNWQAFVVSFGLLFVAELGDKTQLAVLSLSSKYGDAWAVLGGAALALTLVTALGVVGGRMLCDLVPQRLILWLSAALFIVIGAWMGLGAL